MVKITKQEYEHDIVGSGFKCRYPIQRSGKGNKYYYLVDNDYENYLKYISNRKKLRPKVVETL